MTIFPATVAAKLLGGEASRNRVTCPGPGHGPRDRSLSVLLDPSAPGGFVVHSFAGDGWKECRDYVSQRLGIDLPAYNDPERSIAPAAAANVDRARELWTHSSPIGGTPAETYLVARGLPRVPEWRALRFIERCPFGKDMVAALLAAMSDPVSGEFRGIQRTRLSPKERRMLGKAAGSVVCLSDYDVLRDELNVCEGVETGLALLGMGVSPVWAALSAKGLASLTLVPEVQRLSIFADHDHNGTGEEAAKACAQRWCAAGRSVSILKPQQVGTDFADYGGVA